MKGIYSHIWAKKDLWLKEGNMLISIHQMLTNNFDSSVQKTIEIHRTKEKVFPVESKKGSILAASLISYRGYVITGDWIGVHFWLLSHPGLSTGAFQIKLTRGCRILAFRHKYPTSFLSYQELCFDKNQFRYTSFVSCSHIKEGWCVHACINWNVSFYLWSR